MSYCSRASESKDFATLKELHHKKEDAPGDCDCSQTGPCPLTLLEEFFFFFFLFEEVNLKG